MQTLDSQQKRSRPAGQRAKRSSAVLESLIYEIIDGRPLYYQGYKQVLAGKKTKEAIMGSSSLQWVLCSFFMEFMILNLNRKTYWFASNEAGVHIDHRDNLSHDVAIYEKSVLTPDKISTNYVDVPAKVVVEIDVKADLSKVEDRNYVNLKTKKILDFGTEKVIWVFTDTQQVLVAERNADAWLTMNWNRDLELLDGQFFNVVPTSHRKAFNWIDFLQDSNVKWVSLFEMTSLVKEMLSQTGCPVLHQTPFRPLIRLEVDAGRVNLIRVGVGYGQFSPRQLANQVGV